MAVEKLNIHMQKEKESRHSSYSFHKDWFKIDHNSKCKKKTTKFLEDNLYENRGHLGFGNEVLATTSKSSSMKEKMVNLDIIKFRNYL